VRTEDPEELGEVWSHAEWAVEPSAMAWQHVLGGGAWHGPLHPFTAPVSDSKINQKTSRANFTFTFFDLLAPVLSQIPNLKKPYSSALAFSLLLLKPIRWQTSFCRGKTHT